MSAPQEPRGGMYVESFFLEDEIAHIKGPLEDRRVFIECWSRNKLSDFDVVSVHSLGSNRFDTWSCGDVFWPDYIVDDSPSARVILFNSDTRVWREPSLGAIREAADNLMSLLRTARMDSPRERRIIWVTHSLGGFLVKAACISPAEVLHSTRNILHDNLKNSTSGAIFMGTSHRAFLMIEEVVNFLSRSHSAIYEHQMRIFTFYVQHEASGINLPILVTSFQNGLFHPRETRETLPGNYLTMCRFQSRLNPGYERFKYSLEAIRSVPMDLDNSKDINPVISALYVSNLMYP
ncbi:hypothetical protein F4803DRAFT_546764 [Xylaria telfairii]|nr:hypothetical protein F4803DRAFT_546764 [Xylaria telfairii]